eukprot:TRINITY_DN17200_c0_g1_i5.p1 TRINITY_DN17200_c0_g1~~TRINITY_DN17200_c0_g1_i5.p1  ORF type:complete len:313 (-),score=44.64 TRINITY_DN17200_c0_g1_i5:369-1250(-)
MSLLGDTETDGWSHADIVSSRSAFHGPAPISSRERHGAETLSDVVSSSGSLQHAIGRTVNLQRFSVFPKRPDMVRRLYRTASQTLTSFTETMPQTLRRFRTEVAMAEKLIMSITDHVRLPMIIELEEQLFGDDSFLRDLETEAARSLKVYKEHVEGGLQHQQLRHYERLVHIDHAWPLLRTELRTWFAGAYPGNQPHDRLRQHMEMLAYKFLESTVRTELPDINHRIKKADARKQKVDKAIEDAETKFRTMDVKELYASSMMELHALRRKNQNKAVVSEADALGFLMKDNNEL